MEYKKLPGIVTKSTVKYQAQNQTQIKYSTKPTLGYLSKIIVPDITIWIPKILYFLGPKIFHQKNQTKI